MSGLQLMIPPFVACMVLVAMLSYLGLHVIAREVIFVDLSLAQMAALGGLSALLIHVEADSTWAYVFALFATAVGALLFALTRSSPREERRVPQEAFIGIVYVVASAAAVLVANKVPGGGEAIEKTLTGSILWVTFKPTIVKLAVAYAALGVFHYFLRHRFLTISFHPEEAERLGWKIKWWDFLFYLSFGVVITLAVPVAGVLMVFSFLVVPAVIAFLFTRDMRRLTYISWGSGALASILGLWLSLAGDLPTGPLIVWMYGIVLPGAASGRAPSGCSAPCASCCCRGPPRGPTPVSTPRAPMPLRTSSRTPPRAARASTRRTAPCVISSARPPSRHAPPRFGSTSPTPGRCSGRVQPYSLGHSVDPTHNLEPLPRSPSDAAIRARRPHVNRSARRPVIGVGAGSRTTHSRLRRAHELEGPISNAGGGVARRRRIHDCSAGRRRHRRISR